MNDTELLEHMQENGPIESEAQARDAVDAVLTTLGERITDGQADDFAATLPDAGAEPLRDADPGEAQSFSTKEFLERVQERTDRDAEPLPTSRAVLAAVREAADEAEYERTREQLQGEFDFLFEPGQPMDAETFLERVDENLPEDVDPETATEATLETLSDRITGGEAVDLSTYLPREVRRPLFEADEEAASFDRESFLEHVEFRAELVDVDPLPVAHAVLETVVDTTPETELERVRTQLSADFDPLFEGAEA